MSDKVFVSVEAGSLIASDIGSKFACGFIMDGEVQKLVGVRHTTDGTHVIYGLFDCPDEAYVSHETMLDFYV